MHPIVRALEALEPDSDTELRLVMKASPTIPVQQGANNVVVTWNMLQGTFVSLEGDGARGSLTIKNQSEEGYALHWVFDVDEIMMVSVVSKLSSPRLHSLT